MIKKIDSEMLRMKVLLIQPIPCFEVEKNLTAAGLSRIPRKQTSIFLQTMIPELYVYCQDINVRNQLFDNRVYV